SPSISFVFNEECRIFTRMVFILGLESNLSMKIIAFWLWLEENKCKDVIQRLNSLDDRYLLAVCDVAKSFLDSLRLSYSSKDHTHPSEGHFKQAFRDVAICGINYHLDNVCHKVLLDIRKQVHQSCIDKLVEEMDRVHFGAESIRNQNSFHTNNDILRCKDLVQYHSTMKDVANSSLSSNVSSFTNRKTPREERMLFVTFSNGHPLSEEQLQAFFMRHFGDVERVYVPEPADNKPSLYAHITFYSLATLLRVLNGNGKGKVKFVIEGKHLRARRFVPKNEYKQNLK
ncbi:uncharacterized protein LOC141827071, partial [Curcuma longa]|uniref:uncharacterized protein LOC141827071 n=1 Tax=Curcuma longa TaxID=136217 RepID=UPI003D9F82F8